MMESDPVLPKTKCSLVKGLAPGLIVPLLNNMRGVPDKNEQTNTALLIWLV